MIERLEAIETRYHELEQELTNPDVYSDMNKMRTLSKEKADLEETVVIYNRYKQVIDGIKDAKEMIKDPEMAELAREELEMLEKEKPELESELEILLIPKDPNDSKNVIVEIRGAAGGDEANIFAGDLYRMYSRYAEKQGFKIELINAEEGEAGGCETARPADYDGQQCPQKVATPAKRHQGAQRLPASADRGADRQFTDEKRAVEPRVYQTDARFPADSVPTKGRTTHAVGRHAKTIHAVHYPDSVGSLGHEHHLLRLHTQGHQPQI